MNGSDALWPCWCQPCQDAWERRRRAVYRRVDELLNLHTKHPPLFRERWSA